MQLLYSSDGERLFTLSKDGTLCVHDVLQLYLPLKFLPTSPSLMANVCMALSGDAHRLCTVTQDLGSKHVGLLTFTGAQPCA